ncbi:MAG: pyridoxal phosphate-dependent aminotransferase, partial [Myxococcota bacterium]
MRPLVEPHLRALVPYVPGKPIEETEREYGVSGIAKLASNENCLGPSPLAIAAMQRVLSGLHLYPDADGFYLKKRLAARHAAHGVDPRQIIVGNGTNEILTLCVRAFLGPGEALLNAWPSFVVYRLAARSCGRDEVTVPLDASLKYDVDGMLAAVRERSNEVKLVFVANPNNPTGTYLTDEELSRFVDGLPCDVVLILDEAYAEYVTATDYPDGLQLALSRPRTLLTRTFSKAFGLAALRVGYAVGDIELIEILNRLRDPFNVSSLGQAAALAALDDLAHVERSRDHNAEELPRVAAGLRAMGLKVWPS